MPNFILPKLRSNCLGLWPGFGIFKRSLDDSNIQKGLVASALYVVKAGDSNIKGKSQ